MLREGRLSVRAAARSNAVKLPEGVEAVEMGDLFQIATGHQSLGARCVPNDLLSRGRAEDTDGGSGVCLRTGGYRHAGCRDIVHDSLNGLLGPPHDVEKLVEALERLILDHELRTRPGVAGRALAERKFALPKVLNQFWELYSELRVPVA
jgi:hypothetical protein